LSNNRTQTGPEQIAWEAHNVSQLVYFESLSLREKMHAVQGMADVVRRFAEMRANGEFRALSESRHTYSTSPSQTACESDSPYTPDPRERKST
jgi:hypothetical protein